MKKFHMDLHSWGEIAPFAAPLDFIDQDDDSPPESPIRFHDQWTNGIRPGPWFALHNAREPRG